MQMNVATIIVNWNSEKYLKKCLVALGDQTLSPFRIIVLDNNSRSFDTQSWESQFPDVEFCSLKENIGFAAASNIGASMVSDCQWLAFLNPDVFPEPDWLETLVNAIIVHPDFNFFASLQISDLQPNLIDGAGDVYHTSGLAWRRNHHAELENHGIEREEVFGACGGTALILRKAFMDANGYDERFFCYFEDVDLSFRLRLLGGRCLFIPEAKVRHVGSGSTSQWSDFATYHGHRNMIFTYFKNMPLSLFWYYLPQHLFLNIFSLFWCAKRGQIRIALQAKWDAIKKLTAVLKDRKNIQKRRVVSTATLAKLLSCGFIRHHHLDRLRLNNQKS